ncbi:MAG: histone deacetylase [Chloroflexi bacterium]|nr:histone deacetylase [Chloroflexota bacterium]
MRIYYSDTFALPLPEGHRFPIAKYALLREQVVAERSGDLFIAEAAADADILRAHDRDYLRRMQSALMEEREMRRIGFPWSPQLVERSRRSVGATIGACRAALAGDGFAVSLAGGTHHAYADHGEGYCVFNDSAIAARVMQAEGRIRRALIVDCDVHQGNGTAAIFAEDETIFTFSIHSAKNYPFHKERSHLDIALDDGTGDEAYLVALEDGLSEAIERSRADLAIYLAGADPYQGDRLGRLKLTKDGLLARDRLVFETCRAAGIPVAITMAGGYGRNIADTVEIHANTVRLAAVMSV